MAIYKINFRGYRKPNHDCVVEYDEYNGHFSPLPLYLSEANHSPTGFEWGYYGSGPSQLAFAMLRKLVGFERAQENSTAFKQAVIAAIHVDKWYITEDEIMKWYEYQIAHPYSPVPATVTFTPTTNGYTNITICVSEE